MANAAQIVAAFRDVAATKSLSDEEMTDLVKDGMLAGLARIYGPTVQAEIDIDEDTGDFDIVVLQARRPGCGGPRFARSRWRKPAGTTTPSRSVM